MAEIHVAQIPQAVSIAASPDPSISPQLRQEAIEYLNKVKVLSEETWQACFALYIQGAGASAASPVGRDGKEKLSAELRVYCLQVVDDALGNKPMEAVSEADLQALYQAMVTFVQTEYVEGSSEQGMSYMRNKLCHTLTLVFLRLYPSSLPDFLQPFLSFLSAPESSTAATMSPALVTLHMLCEIAGEVHDPLLKSARENSEARRLRDMQVRDSLRQRDDSKLVMEALETLVQRGLVKVDDRVWAEAVEWGLRAMCSWAPWVDIAVAVTPSTLRLYQTLVAHTSPMLQEAGLTMYFALLHKGMKTGADKLQVLNVLDVMSFITPLEAKSRGREEMAGFRTGLARVLCEQGIEALKLTENNESDQATRQQAETIYNATLPYLIRFMEDDSSDETTQAIIPLLNDTLRLYKKARKANETTFALPPDKIDFVNTLLETVVKRMQWRTTATWGMGADDDEDADPEEVEAFNEMRKLLRSIMDSISEIDPNLFNNKVGGLVMEIYGALDANGPSSVSWQQAELAVYMTYVYGETQKVGMGKEAFFSVPADVAEMLRQRTKAKADSYRAIRKGESNGLDPELRVSANVDFSAFPLMPQGQMLLRAVQAQVFSYPHPAVNLQFFECSARYSEFFKARKELIQPVLEAYVDTRGIHQPQASVRERVFYLFAKFVKDVKGSVDPSFVSAILGGMGDVLPVVAVLPEVENPEEDILIKATTGAQPFDNQLYLFEAVGTLIGLLWRDPQEQLRLLQAVLGPLIRDIDAGLQKPLTGNKANDALSILQIHHLITAIGAIAKGFPEAPDILPPEAPVWIAAFEQAGDAIFRALDVMKSQRVVRDAARSAFSGIFAALSTRMSRFIPDLVVRMIDQCEAQEMSEFMAFLGMLVHKLRGGIFSIMDELWPHLLQRINLVLALPVSGTDDTVLQQEMKKSYVSFISTILTTNVQDFLISERNKGEFENFIRSLETLAADADRNNQKSAVNLLYRTVAIWANNPAVAALPNFGVFLNDAAALRPHAPLKKNGPTNGEANGTQSPKEQGLPGYEQMVYDRILPLLFRTIMDQGLKLKDGQSQLVVHEVAVFLREVAAARGMEGIETMSTRVLPSLDCPPQAAAGLMERLRVENVKDFRKTFLDFIKEWRAQIYASA